jgi:hypothetical protein
MEGRSLGHVSKQRRFTRQEVDALLAEVWRYRDVLLLSAYRKTCGMDEARSRAWLDISVTVSEVSGILRKPNDVRKKWTDLKSLTQRLRHVNPSAVQEDEIPRMVSEIISGATENLTGSGECRQQRVSTGGCQFYSNFHIHKDRPASCFMSVFPLIMLNTLTGFHAT